MDNKEYITLKNKNGVEEKVELILAVSKKNKQYLLYKNNKGEIFASYVLDSDDILHNDLSDEEYDMLEKIYAKGVSIYDK